MSLSNPCATSRGVILLAGGEGSRLGIPYPKGCLEIKGKSLFERFLNKAQCPVAIMVSEATKQETESFLKKHDCFGKEVQFFCQESIDVIGGCRKAPAGNGDLFRAFYASSIFNDWKTRGIKLIQVAPIDNVLVDPQDPTLNTLYQLTIQVVKKKKKEEKMGEVGLKEGRVFVKEYFEGGQGGGLGYVGVFGATLDFFELCAKLEKQIPYHLVEKIERGEKIIKREKFIFDFFPFTTDVTLVEIEREKGFLPIKNLVGDDSLEEANKVIS